MEIAFLKLLEVLVLPLVNKVANLIVFSSLGVSLGFGEPLGSVLPLNLDQVRTLQEPCGILSKSEAQVERHGGIGVRHKDARSVSTRTVMVPCGQTQMSFNGLELKRVWSSG